MVATPEKRETVPPCLHRSDLVEYDDLPDPLVHGRQSGGGNRSVHAQHGMDDRRLHLHHHRLEVSMARSIRIPAVRQHHHL